MLAAMPRAPTATFLYKILPPFPAPPSPLPRELPISDHDARLGCIHLATSYQVIRTLSQFFPTAPHVYILRIPYARVSLRIRWEPDKGTPPPFPLPPEFWPHIFPIEDEYSPDYGLKFGRDEVDAVACWIHGDGEWDPKDWPFNEDKPS